MNFAEIGQRTKLGLRQLRYVVDYEVLDPEYYGQTDRAQTGHGIAREFSLFAAFAVAMTTVLRETGLNRSRVRSALEAILDWASLSNIPGEHAMLDTFVVFRAADAIDIEIADGKFLRVVAKKPRSSRTGMGIPKTSSWINLDEGGQTDSAPKALFTTRISLCELLDRLLE
jgi:hypothetical protein